MNSDIQVSVWPLLLSSNVTTFSFKTQKLILWLRDSVVHNNVTHFYGLTTDDGKLGYRYVFRTVPRSGHIQTI